MQCKIGYNEDIILKISYNAFFTVQIAYSADFFQSKVPRTKRYLLYLKDTGDTAFHVSVS